MPSASDTIIQYFYIMGTEVAISFSALRAQLENEKSSLFKIDENIKKIVQTSARFNHAKFNTSGDFQKGGFRVGGRNSVPDAGINYKNDEHFFKRKHETKTVFSRLSARTHDSDGEDDGPGHKRTRVPSAVCRELPTRAAVLRAQGDDEQARTRNRRIFGSLMGTLQKFKQEEIVLQTKEEKKAQVERKIEEQARLLKEKEQRERKTLFAEREHKKSTIKALEAKMERVQEFEMWEASQKYLSDSILTKAKPHIYWLPKIMTEKATEKLDSSRKFHEKCMSKKRLELQEELQRIELRCMRVSGPGAKENHPDTHVAANHNNTGPKKNVKDTPDLGVDEDVQMMDFDADKGKKRDKFAADADEKEESEGDERHDDVTEIQDGVTEIQDGFTEIQDGVTEQAPEKEEKVTEENNIIDISMEATTTEVDKTNNTTLVEPSTLEPATDVNTANSDHS